MFEYSGETLGGVIDGRNQTFVASSGMGPGSVSVYLNGILLTPGLDTGWVQLDDVTVRLKEAPQFGDVVAVGYLSVTAGYKLATLQPMVAMGAEITPLVPSLGSAPLGLGGLAIAPLSLGANIQTVPGPGLVMHPLIPELAPA